MFRRLVLALPAFLLAAAPAAAQQQMTWHTLETDDGAALVFGVPETDESMIFFLCTRGADDIITQPMIGTKGLKKGDKARAILSAGSVKKIFNGTAVASAESGAINVEGKGKMADLEALAKAGPQLTIETKGAKKTIGLEGAEEALGQFTEACKPR